MKNLNRLLVKILLLNPIKWKRLFVSYFMVLAITSSLDMFLLPLATFTFLDYVGLVVLETLVLGTIMAFLMETLRKAFLEDLEELKDENLDI